MRSTKDSIWGKNLLSIEECMTLHNEPGIVFLDASWYLKDRDGRADFESGPRIPGARYFDINDVSSPSPQGFPHMMPSKELFAAAMDALRVKNSDDVIVYGGEGNMANARVWFTFRSMGHDPDKVHVMSGSFEKWMERGGPVDTFPASAVHCSQLDLSVPSSYQATDAQNVATMRDVLEALASADSVVVDARSAARFYGKAPEPRPSLPSGHMPNALNLPFTHLLASNDFTRFLDRDAMREHFRNIGLEEVDTEKKVIVTCGSGVTACTLALALQECGRNGNTHLFDGSWVEWASDPNNPIEDKSLFN